MFRLALALGKTLGELSAMPSSELTEWAAFYLWEQGGAATQPKVQSPADQRAVLEMFVAAAKKSGKLKVVEKK